VNEIQSIKILLIEDDPSDADLIREILSEADLQIEVTHSDRMSSALERLELEQFDVILSDLGLPDSQGIDTFCRVRDHANNTPVIVLTGLIDEEFAVNAVQKGAQDYLVKGRVDAMLLSKAIRYSIHRKKLLVELETRLKEIARLERERNNLLSMLAHDMKNSIVPSIHILGEILSGETEELQANLQLVQDELKTVNYLATNFMEFARFNLKEYSLVPCRMEMRPLIEKQIQIAKVKAEQKDLKIYLEIPRKSLPLITADRNMVNRVITNLIDNAIKYTSPGGVVTVRVLDRKEDLLIEVEDTGEGIPVEHVPFLFDAFYRADKVQKGSGLGLAVARTIVEAHGGKIWVESTPGKGSRFCFILPKSV
jgi:signal transduction histidine kinase